MNFKRLLRIIFSLLVLFFQNTQCLAWTVAPVRFEIKAEKGKEYTFTFSVLNESQLYQKRFEIQTDDWIINKNNDFLRKAFNKEIDSKYFASKWIKVSPMQFVVPPGETRNIRFTVTVPNDLASDGEYTAGIFVGERNIEKPPKGEKVIHIKQDTYIGVIVYTRVGKENEKVIFKNLQIESKPQSKELSELILLPTFENLGNIHGRGHISIKLEPLSESGQKEAKEKKLEDEIDGGEVVVLRESEVTYPVSLPFPLMLGNEWKFVVKTDFGNSTPVLVGTKRFKISVSK